MNETSLTWLVFILAFGGMVIIHEFGHFIVARLCKIEVEEFGIGLPTPGAITLFKWQGTRFTLNWLPLGGFVRPKGENDPNVSGGLAAANPWARLAVLFAGPLMNLLTAVVIYSIIFTRVGVPDTNRVLVTSVVAESPAAQAGFQDDDIFISGNGTPIRSVDDLRAIVDANDGKPVVFLVDRRGEQIELTATPLMNTKNKRVMIGVGLDAPFKPATSWIETINLGARYTYINIHTLISLPAQMMRGTVAPEQGRLIGLKGIYDVFSQTVSRDVDATTTAQTSTDPIDQPIRTLDLIAKLSISLGIFNLFPFPALDGGRILFILPELIFRRRVSPQVETLVHGLGMAVLLAFMVYVNVMDFVDPIAVTIP
ncbi:MAG: M50 family metallopeptidase [Anaerolineae bacterium]|nr:M50 family metallopeptidase [Anaerolineae bacterium]MCI0611056.1 M50 family metallopeptidase [Anaerolineae bacterium]